MVWRHRCRVFLFPRCSQSSRGAHGHLHSSAQRQPGAWRAGLHRVPEQAWRPGLVGQRWERAASRAEAAPEEGGKARSISGGRRRPTNNREVRRAHRAEAQRVSRRALGAGQDPACPGAGVRWSCKRPPVSKVLASPGPYCKNSRRFYVLLHVYLCLLP